MDDKAPPLAGLLEGSEQKIEGTFLSGETLKEQLRARSPYKAFCLVEQWVVLRADLSADELSVVEGRGYQPLFLFAHRVVEDSRRRFQPGDWVRSSMCVSFTDGVMFETRNTTYVLMGAGVEKTASLKTIFSIF